MPSRYSAHLSEIGTAVIDELTERNRDREQALSVSREVIRFSANAIRAVHRSDFDDARELIGKGAARLQCEAEPGEDGTLAAETDQIGAAELGQNGAPGLVSMIRRAQFTYRAPIRTEKRPDPKARPFKCRHTGMPIRGTRERGVSLVL